jgi:hypothetical protein
MTTTRWFESALFSLPLGFLGGLFPQQCDDGWPGSGGHGGADGCAQACPIRVDPRSTFDGDGTSWATARNDLQSALDQQAAAGGGEVWVLGGEAQRLTSAGGDLIRVPQGVVLRGGFVGVETLPSQRDASNPPTVLRGPGPGTPATLLTVVSAIDDVMVERLRLVDGQPALRVEAAENVTLRDVEMLASVAGSGIEAPLDAPIELKSSVVRFEHSNVNVPFGDVGITLRDSEIALMDSEVSGLAITMAGTDFGRFPKLSVEGGLLLSERTRWRVPVSISAEARALFVDSSLSGGQGIRSALSVSGSAAVVGSTVNSSLGFAPIVASGPTLVFNSNIGAAVTFAHGNYPQGWAVQGVGPLDISVSLFTGHCDIPSSENCPALFSSDGSSFASVNNSLFAPQRPNLPDSPPPIESLAANGALPASNCIVYSDQVSIASDRLTSPHPCLDGGDATALEQSRTNLLEFAAPFLAAPLHANLGRYQAPNWWRSESVVAGLCEDRPPPDPGRHSKVSCTP